MQHDQNAITALGASVDMPESLRPRWSQLFALAWLARRLCDKLRFFPPVGWAAAWLFLFVIAFERVGDRVIAREGSRAVLIVAPVSSRMSRRPAGLLVAACWLAMTALPLWAASDWLATFAVGTGSRTAVFAGTIAPFAVAFALFIVVLLLTLKSAFGLWRGARAIQRRHCESVGGTWWEVSTLAGRHGADTKQWLQDDLLPLVDSRCIGLFLKVTEPRLMEYYGDLGFVPLLDDRPQLMYRPAATSHAAAEWTSVLSAAA